MNLLEKMPPHVRAIAQLFARAQRPVYAVGGCVRGAVMGLPAADFDLCGSALTEEVLALLEGQGEILPTRIYGRMGTMRLVCQEGYAEYTTFRQESYGAGHRPESVRFASSVEEDAFRRDFSCNAIYLDLHSGELADPTGGLPDIRSGTLRATTSDPGVILRDDGLRVLRMMRFAAQLRFSIDPATYACADAALLRDIARERLAEELSLILLADARYDLPGGKEALTAALGQLAELGAAEVLLPGVALDIPSCAAMPPDLPLRFAALLQGNAPEEVRQALRGLRYPSALCAEVAALLQGLSVDAQDAFTLIHKGFPFLERLCALRPELLPKLKFLVDSGAPDSLSKLALDGQEVSRLLGGDSPLVGEALRALWRHAVLHPGENTPEALASYINKWRKGRSQ